MSNSQQHSAVDDSYITEHDTPIIIFPPGVLGNDVASDSNPLISEVTSSPGNGTLRLGKDGSFVYRPNIGFVGTDTFRYTVFTPDHAGNEATVSVSVNEPQPTIEVPDIVGQEYASYQGGGDMSWAKPAGFGDEVAVYIESISASTESPYETAASPLGQVIVDPAQSQWLRYNGGSSYFMAGAGDPEDFFFRGLREPDGTRTGDQRAIIEQLASNGVNGIYVMAVRSHGGDGNSTHNPFIDGNPESGLDEEILHQWELWISELNAKGVTVLFIIYDDSSRIWDTGDNVGIEERAFVESLVNRFKHHKLLVWCIAEEYAESFSPQRVSNLATVVRNADEYNHPIAVHKNPGFEFDEFADDPNIDQFGLQYPRTSENQILYDGMLQAFQLADGKYNLNMMEIADHGTGAAARQFNWSVAMAGSYVMVFGMDGVTTSASDLFELGLLSDFMESAKLNGMSPDNSLAHAGTEYVLADTGSKYIAYKAATGSDSLGVKGVPEGLYSFHWIDTVNGFLLGPEVEASLADQGLKLGEVSVQFDHAVPAGRIISQTPSPGEVVESGAAVDVVVSLGSETTHDHDSARAAALATIISSIESYGDSFGTYVVEGGGFRGRGQGWFYNNSASTYPQSIAEVLVNNGYLELPLPKDPFLTNPGITSRYDFMAYRCKDRIAVFSKSDQIVTAAESIDWWAENQCSRSPIERYDHPFFKLSKPLTAATPQDSDIALALRSIVDAVELFAADNGTFRLTGGGARGRGQGWFHLGSTAGYPVSIADMLIDMGYLEAPAPGESFLNNSGNRSSRDFLVYRCKDRLAVFAQVEALTPGQDDIDWWYDNNCTRYPMDRRDQTYFLLSSSLSELQGN